jgi:hypothetical protein
VDKAFEIQSIERYNPYTKNDNSDPVIRIGQSGHISISEKVYSQWIEPCKKVDLNFIILKDTNSGESKYAIGIKPLTTNEGLSVVKPGPSKSRYLSAKGFLAKHNIPTDGNNRLVPFFDPTNKIVIAPLEVNPKVREKSASRSVSSANDASNSFDLRESILSILPSRTSGKPPLSVPDIMRLVAGSKGDRLAARTQANKRAYRSKIQYAIKALFKEKRLEEGVKKPWRTGSGTYTTYYYKA